MRRANYFHVKLYEVVWPLVAKRSKISSRMGKRI